MITTSIENGDFYGIVVSSLESDHILITVCCFWYDHSEFWRDHTYALWTAHWHSFIMTSISTLEKENDFIIPSYTFTNQSATVNKHVLWSLVCVMVLFLLWNGTRRGNFLESNAYHFMSAGSRGIQNVCLYCSQAKMAHSTWTPQCHGKWYCGKSSCNALRCDVDPRKLIVRATRKPQDPKSEIWFWLAKLKRKISLVTLLHLVFARLQSCFNHMFTSSCVDSPWLPDPVDCLVVRRDASQDCLGWCKATENLYNWVVICRAIGSIKMPCHTSRQVLMAFELASLPKCPCHRRCSLLSPSPFQALVNHSSWWPQVQQSKTLNMLTIETEIKSSFKLNPHLIGSFWRFVLAQ